MTSCHVDPIVDLKRLTALAAYDFAHPGLRPELDDVARRAATELGAAAAMITLALPDVALLAGAFGLGGWITEVGGVPIEWAPCAIAVRTGRGYAVPDADADPAFAGNPLVAIDGIKALAGAPLRAPDGTVLGACCGGLRPASFQRGAAPGPGCPGRRGRRAGLLDPAASLTRLDPPACLTKLDPAASPKEEPGDPAGTGPFGRRGRTALGRVPQGVRA